MTAPPKLLLTTFQPFRGRPVNGSETIGNALSRHAESRAIHVVSLPVVWGSVENLALPLARELRPAIILGLGEGAPDALKIETRAYNQRSGRDEMQKVPSRAKIDPEGPEIIESRWPLPNTLPEHPSIPTIISQDAGRYLCNNALYRYCQSDCPIAGFLHLPPQGRTPDQDYADHWLPLILQLIDTARKSLCP